MEFSRQDYGMGCHFLLQGIFPTQGLAGEFFTRKPLVGVIKQKLGFVKHLLCLAFTDSYSYNYVGISLSRPHHTDVHPFGVLIILPAYAVHVLLSLLPPFNLSFHHFLPTPQL